MKELKTTHLLLRQWREEDLEPYAKLTASKEVMKYFPQTLTVEQSNRAARKFQKLLEERGWGFWAVEERVSGQFIGYAGLHAPQTQFPFSPCIEIAWRMGQKYWENGYVLEAGEAILRAAFEIFGLEEIVYFSSVKNKKGEEVATALKMQKEEQTFHHPFVEREHPLSEHYLYRIKNGKL